MYAPRVGAVVVFEIRLREFRPSCSLLFVTSRKTSDEAVEYARRLLERHPEFHIAEVWNGMQLVREI
jgi:hypothetical protein